MKKEALGRGLDALLGEVSEAYENESSTRGDVVEIPLNQLSPNPYQPRKDFSSDSLKELCESIKKDGLIQPITVVEDGLDGYIIVAGERRYRASKLAKLETIKAIVLDISKEQMQQFALIENIQREDLNPIELARSYKALIELHGITHEELSNVIHKSRAHITNTLRLLQLSAKTQEALVSKKISAGHAKVLVGLDEKNQTLMVNSIIGQKLSVREVEHIIKGIKQNSGGTKELQPASKKTKLSFETLKEYLKTLNITTKNSANSLTLQFENQEQIETFLAKIKR